MVRGPQVGVGFWLQSIALTLEKDQPMAGHLGVDSNYSDRRSQHHSFVTGKDKFH